MSEYNKLLNNIQSANAKLDKEKVFNLSTYFLPDNEIAKKLLAYKNPKMDPRDIELIVDGLQGNNPNKPNSILELEAISNEADTPNKKRVANKKIDGYKNNSYKPLPKSDPLYIEVDELKSNLSSDVSSFTHQVKELVEEKSINSVNETSSIVGGIQMVITPFFPNPSVNIPGMITLLMGVVLHMKTMQQKCRKTLELYTKLSKLNLVLSNSNLETVSKALNTFYITLTNTICVYTTALNNFISKIFNSILKITNKRSEQEKIVIQNVTRQLIKMKYLPDESEASVDGGNKIDVRNILKEWKVVNRYSPDNAVARKRKEADIDPDVDMNKLEKLVKDISTTTVDLNSLLGGSIPNTSLSINNSLTPVIVYDIEFPNGEVIKGISESELLSYQDRYNLIYSDDKFTLSKSPISLSPFKIN